LVLAHVGIFLLVQGKESHLVNCRIPVESTFLISVVEEMQVEMNKEKQQFEATNQEQLM